MQYILQLHQYTELSRNLRRFAKYTKILILKANYSVKIVFDEEINPDEYTIVSGMSVIPKVKVK